MAVAAVAARVQQVPVVWAALAVEVLRQLFLQRLLLVRATVVVAAAAVTNLRALAMVQAAELVL